MTSVVHVAPTVTEAAESHVAGDTSSGPVEGTGSFGMTGSQAEPPGKSLGQVHVQRWKNPESAVQG